MFAKIKTLLLSNKIEVIEFLFLTFIIGFSYIIFSCSFHQFNGGFHFSYIFVGLFFPLIIVFLLFERKHNRRILDRKLLIILFVLLISYVFTVSCFEVVNPNVATYKYMTFFVDNNPISKLISFELYLILLIDIYIILFIYANNACNKTTMRLIIWVYFAFCFFAIIYSLIKERDVYASVFDPEYQGKIILLSFTNNRNIYGAYLLFGIIASLLNDIKKPKIINHVFSLLFYLFLLFIRSANCLIVGTVLIIFQLIFGGIRMIVMKRRWSLIYGISLLSLTSALIIFIPIACTVDGIPFFSHFFKVLINSLEEKDFTSLSGRSDIFYVYLRCLVSSPKRFIFGFGHQINMLLIEGKTDDTLGAHNGFIQTWADGGFLFLVFFVFIIVLCVISIIRMFKKEKIMPIYYLVVLIAILTHGSFEAMDRLVINPTGLFFMCLVLAPIMKQGKSKRYSNIYIS